jgi:hypothetical protein
MVLGRDHRRPHEVPCCEVRCNRAARVTGGSSDLAGHVVEDGGDIAIGGGMEGGP